VVTDSRQKIPPEIACFATQGTRSRDHSRIVTLLELVEPVSLEFNHGSKLRSSLRLLLALLRRRPALVVMEGTGVAGGLALIAARLLAGIRYVVSSGDAVGAYVKIDNSALAPLAGLYERLLCRLSSGYIGWTPYLVGRALTFGAPRAMTAANWAAPPCLERRAALRAELGIPEEALVFGIVGSLQWSDSVGYCYGLELVRALRRVERHDLRVLIIGDGSGLARLQDAAGDELGRRVLLPGRVSPGRVSECLAAIDVASLPQSVDGVGSFRYTTKLSEYLASALPVVTGQIPLAYDLDDGWLWRLTGEAPWDRRYLEALADLMRTLSREELAQRRAAVPTDLPLFDRARQQRAAASFVSDLLTAD
jgi:glycosyl transferase family 1